MHHNEKSIKLCSGLLPGLGVLRKLKGFPCAFEQSNASLKHLEGMHYIYPPQIQLYLIIAKSKNTLHSLRGTGVVM